jgi:hypothetical protein
VDDLLNYYQCDGCWATYKISHSLNDANENYKIEYCPFCGSNEVDEDEITKESFLDDSD